MRKQVHSDQNSKVDKQLEILRDLIRRHLEGIAIGEIERDTSVANFDLSRGTIRNRIDRLINEGSVERRGKSRGTRYFPARETRQERQLSAGLDSSIADHFHRPVGLRPAVDYDRTLIEEYVPNESFLLSLEDRVMLRDLSRRNSTDPSTGTTSQTVFDRVLMEFSWASSRLEGNTYSLVETEQLLVEGIIPKRANPTETQMILNHKRAIELLFEQSDEIGFNHYTIFNLHSLLTENLTSSPTAGGVIRSRPVTIRESTYTPPSGGSDVEILFDLILDKAAEIRDPFEAGFFILTHNSYLQPFNDGNEPTSRLAANIPIIQANLSPVTFYGTGTEYTQALLALYELRLLDPLRRVFIAAYQESARRYAEAQAPSSSADPFRIRYRPEVAQLIASIVCDALDRSAANERIRIESMKIPPGDRDRFVQLVEEELRDLTESNIARYRIRVREYRRWRDGW